MTLHTHALFIGYVLGAAPTFAWFLARGLRLAEDLTPDEVGKDFEASFAIGILGSALLAALVWPLTVCVGLWFWWRDA